MPTKLKMNRFYYSLLLLAILLSICAEARSRSKKLHCLYDSRGTFLVRHRGKVQKRKVDAGYPGGICVASEKLAAVYDGDDLHVFDSKREEFVSKNVDNQAAIAKLTVSSGLVLFYDGDDLFVYDSHHGQFFEEIRVDSGFGKAVLSAGDRVGSFYDGDDLLAYDSYRKAFLRAFANDNHNRAQLFTDSNTVIAYDGGDLYSYCPTEGSWQKESGVGKRTVMTPILDEDMRLSGVLAGGKKFKLNRAHCRF